MLQMLYELQQMLAEIAGLPAVSLQPAAGAQGELTALLVAAAYFRDRGEARTRRLVSRQRHGTNPASAAWPDSSASSFPSEQAGLRRSRRAQSRIDEKTAVFMITNPNTLGLFETQIAEIARLLHDAGALMYIDGANMNAILGITRPGDFGGDMMHFNVHKTFTGPHGAGGPGAGPIAVRAFLADYLPGPLVVRDEKSGARPMFRLAQPAKSIGRMRTFVGNVGILLRGYMYIRTLGPEGLKAVSNNAVLNANYLMAKLKDLLPVPHGIALHARVRRLGEGAPRRAGHLGDRSCQAAARLWISRATVYFPLVVSEAMMIEPTETESMETLDAFVLALGQIITEDPEFLHQAPHTTPVSRPDDVQAARKPILKWEPAAS